MTKKLFKCLPFCASTISAFLAVAFFTVFIANAPQAFGGGMASDSFSAAMRTFGVWEPETGERFDFAVWYPTRAQPVANVLEGWVVEAGKRGQIVHGFFPVVLVSHCMAGGRFAHNDIAAALAASGMIVIAPTHNGDNQDSTVDLYTAASLLSRPRNLLRALETVLESNIAPYVDESRIGVLGVGIGALTALQLCGAVPEFSALDDHCRSASAGDAFCAPWVQKRLTLVKEEMNRNKQAGTLSEFTPPLDLYAPELINVGVLPQDILDSRQEAREKESKKSFWKRLFDKDEETEAESEADHSAGHEAPDHDADLAQRDGDGEDALPVPHIDADNGKTEKTTQSAGPDSPDSTKDKSADNSRGEKSALNPKIIDGKFIFRQPASVRNIKCVVLVAPAGGMLFNSESLRTVTMPVAVVEAGEDILFPPTRHAAPYGSHLPAHPLKLHQPDLDHFSLFAECSKDTLNTLSDLCGRQRGEARQTAKEKRTNFIVSFFHSALGDALPLPQPSGLAAPDRTPGNP